MGKAIIFSAPSGSGKTTVVNFLLKELKENIEFSISATTRKPRAGEIHGKEYYFITEKEFRERLSLDQFVEYEEVYSGIFYGTLKSEVKRIWDSGKSVIFDVDVKGGIKLKEQFGKHAMALFLKPPSLDALKERLRKRSTEVEHDIQQRIAKANYELSFSNRYDIVVTNDNLEETFSRCKVLVLDFIKLK